MLGANGILMDAFYTDVRPALAEWRERAGCPPTRWPAYAASRATRTQIDAERVGGTQAGWGA